jgi:hypothetical protein
MTAAGVQSWRGLPRDLVDVLQTALVELDEGEPYADAVSELAEQARLRGHAFDPATRANVRLSTRAAVQCFLAELDSDGSQADLALFVAQGRAQHDAGRPLEEMLGFYTMGALIVWRRLVAQGSTLVLTSEQLGALAGAVFAFIHDLSAAGAEGYSQARSEAASTREGRREHLLQMLMAEPPAPSGRIVAAAQLAGYTVPNRLAALAVAVEHIDRVRSAVGASTLTGRIKDVGCVLIAADEGLDWQLKRVLESLPSEVTGGLGEVMPWREAPSSFRSALAAAELAAAAPGSARLVRAEDVPVRLFLASDRRLAERIREKHLGPLDVLDGETRRRLTDTLRAWLDTPGRPQLVATRLGVHVQTVRYRMRQLQDLFGGVLDDPDERFALALALRTSPQVAAGPVDDADPPEALVAGGHS